MMTVGAVAVSGIAAICALFGRQQWIVSRLSARSADVLFMVRTTEQVIALTIDDSPDPVSTPLILDILRAHGATATFFIIGDQVSGNETLLQRIVAEGHELGNHTLHDRASIRVPIGELRDDIAVTHSLLARFGKPRWFRPGSGAYDDSIVAAAAGLGYSTVLGSIYPFDPQIPSTRFIERHVLANAHPGGIVILHDRGARGVRTARALKSILPALSERGYRIVTLSEMVDHTTIP